MATEKDIVESCRKLKLIAEEEDAVVFEDAVSEEKAEEISLSLLGKLFTQEYFSIRTMKTVLQSVWKAGKGMVIREMDHNLFLFQFFSRKDKDFVLNEGPWAFDGHILLVSEWTRLEQPSEITFHTARFWVKAYDVPGIRQTEAFAKFLGSYVGTFISCEKDTMFGADKALCFKVDVDVNKPLRAGLKVMMGNKPILIEFRYVKLPDFCYGCGHLSHTIKSCDEISPDTPEEKLPFGPMLRASPLKTRRRNAEVEIAKEKRLFTAYRANRGSSKIAGRLEFGRSGQARQESTDETVVTMEMDMMTPSGDIFKRRREGDVTPVVGVSPDSTLERKLVEVAEQPHRIQ